MNNIDIILQDKFIRMKLADVRRSKGYTQKEIADKCGLSVSTISNIESGENSYTTRSLIMYTEALGYEISIKRREN